MALNFGGSGFFSKSGLYNEVGELKERWGQGGSQIVNLRFRSNADATIHTVTAGKTLYITHMFICGYAAGGWFTVLDNATTKIVVTSPTTVEYAPVVFATPLTFATSVVCNDGGAFDAEVTMTGWEE